MSVNRDITEEMVLRTKQSTGNNRAIKSCIEKLKSTGDLRIAFLGASITEWCNGDYEHCYARLVCEGLKKAYSPNSEIYSANGRGIPKDQVQPIPEGQKGIAYINAGINGTTSIFGDIRLTQDVLVYEPDMVIIDFGVNDWKDDLYRETFECMIRDILEIKDRNIAIIILANVMPLGYTCQSQYKELAQYYKIQLVAMSDAIMPEFKKKTLEVSDIFEDYVHPNIKGHNLISKSVLYCIQSEYEREEDEPFKFEEKPFHGNTYQHMKYMDARALPVTHMEGFGITQIVYKPFKYLMSKDSSSKKNIIAFDLDCKSFFVVFVESPSMDYGMAYVYVDGELVEKLNGFNTTAWVNLSVKKIFGGEKKPHKIEIKMAPGDERKEFGIIGIAYNE